MNSEKKLTDVLSLSTSNLIAQMAIGLFWFYLASILTKSEYGELSYLMSLATVASVVSFLGLGGTVVVYQSKKENIFPAFFIIVLISGSIVTVIAYFLTQNFTSSILIFGLVIFNILVVGLQSKKQYVLFSKYKILRTAGTIIFAIILYQFFGINGILFGYFLATLFAVKEILSLMKNKKIEFSKLRSKIRFSLFNYSNKLSDVLFTWGDKLVIASLFGFSFLGNYYFAMQFLLLMDVIPRSIGQYLLPQESEGKKNIGIKKLAIISSVIVAIVVIIGVPFGVNTLFPKYNESIILIQILSIAIIPMTISTIQQTQFLGKENSRIVLIGSVLQSGIYLMVIIFLGESLGLIGIATGFLIAVLTRVFFNQFAAKEIH